MANVVDDLEAAFHLEMEAIYERSGQALGYWPHRYLQTVRRKGGRATAKDLLIKESAGFTRLIDAGYPELTVEYLVIQPHYSTLFTSDEVAEAMRRLSVSKTPNSKEVTPGSSWSREEVEATVSAYFEMLEAALRGEQVNKSAFRNSLLPMLNGRSSGAVERKHQNISAILIDEGFPYISGYKPLANYQKLLRVVVLEQIETRRSVLSLVEEEVQRLVDPPRQRPVSSVFTPAPEKRNGLATWSRPSTPRLGVNFLLLEAANRLLGSSGEEFVVRIEQERLEAAGKGSLASRVERVSVTKGDGLGYDVLSYEEDTRERLIEVKTTKFGVYTPFYVTANELAVSRAESDRYSLYRVYNFGPSANIFALPGPLDSSFRLEPNSYIARI